MSQQSSSPSFFDQLGDKAKSAFAEMEDGASDAFKSVSQQIADLKNTEAGKHLMTQLNSLQSRLETQANEFAHEKKQLLTKFEEEKRRAIISHLSEKLSAAIASLMTVIVVKVKDFLTEDPYMPYFVKNMIRTVIDAVWPDISDTFREQILSIAYTSDDKVINHGEPGCFSKSCCCCGSTMLDPVPLPPTEEEDYCCCCEGCCYKLDFDTPCFGPVAYLLYIQFPYDLTIFRQIRKPMWWVLTIIASIPVFGISTIYYILLFIITDKEDEFQLLQFIRSFKCLQFVSIGVISAVVGGGQLAVCSQSNPSTCPDYAPREQLHTIFLFVAQLVVCWIAFFLLPYSKQKGGLRYQLSELKADQIRQKAHQAEKTVIESMLDETVAESLFEEQEDGSEQRARLRNLMLYDLFVFLICAGLVSWAAFGNLLDETANVTNDEFSVADPFLSNGKNWKFQMILFFCKTLYGLASFPWVLMMIPGISALFSKAKPTAINPYGHTVPYVGVEQNTVPWRRRQTPEELEAEQKEIARRQEVSRMKMRAMEAEEERKSMERRMKMKKQQTEKDQAEEEQSTTTCAIPMDNNNIQVLFYNSTLANPDDFRTVSLDNVSLKTDTQKTLKEKLVRIEPSLREIDQADFYLAVDGSYLNDGGNERKTLEEYGIGADSVVQVIKQSDIVQA